MKILYKIVSISLILIFFYGCKQDFNSPISVIPDKYLALNGDTTILSNNFAQFVFTNESDIVTFDPNDYETLKSFGLDSTFVYTNRYKDVTRFKLCVGNVDNTDNSNGIPNLSTGFIFYIDVPLSRRLEKIGQPEIDKAIITSFSIFTKDSNGKTTKVDWKFSDLKSFDDQKKKDLFSINKILLPKLPSQKNNSGGWDSVSNDGSFDIVFSIKIGDNLYQGRGVGQIDKSSFVPTNNMSEFAVNKRFAEKR